MNSTLRCLSVLSLLIPVTLTCADAAVDISSVTVSAIKTDSAVIGWDSTTAGTFRIEYGSTSSYGTVTSEGSLSYFHTSAISGLDEGTLYHFRIRTKEYGGTETVSDDYTFTTRTQSELDSVIQTARIAQGGSGLPKTYYVSGSGNDSDGLSIATAFTTISHGLSILDAGDTLLAVGKVLLQECLVLRQAVP